jgi:transposase
VHAIAMNYRLTLGTSLFTRRGVAELQELPLPTHTAHRREESLELLAWLDARTATLERKIAGVAEADPDARRLMTHPGVGPLTALATLLVLGPVARFPTSKHVVSHVGLAPAIASSAGKHRLGGITKQGNRMLRFVLGQSRAHRASRRSTSQAALLPRPAPSREGAGEGRSRPSALGPVVHHAAGSDRLRGVSPPRTSQGSVTMTPRRGADESRVVDRRAMSSVAFPWWLWSGLEDRYIDWDANRR